MYSSRIQPALKFIEVQDPNLIQAELPALVKFECSVKLPKTNKHYKKLHELVAAKFTSKVIDASGQKNFSLAAIRHLSTTETRELEEQICEMASSEPYLRMYGLLRFPSGASSNQLDVERVEPVLTLDRISPLKYDCTFRLVSKEYLIKEYLGKENYNEQFLYAQESRTKAFLEGKPVKFDLLKLAPFWVKIKDAQVL